MRFTYREKKDLLLAGIMISFAFAILLGEGMRGILTFEARFFTIFAIAFFTAGLGFLLHELMHKYVAQQYGLFAEFAASYAMLWLAIAFSFFGFIFAAPGAVYIRGAITQERNGKISLAGPLVNIVLAIIFALALLFFHPENELWRAFFEVGLSINSLLAVFNMIPAMPFDGAKVIAWHRGVYVIVTLIAIALFILSLWW